jgi:hypothetical protein
LPGEGFDNPGAQSGRGDKRACGHADAVILHRERPFLPLGPVIDNNFTVSLLREGMLYTRSLKD